MELISAQPLSQFADEMLIKVAQKFEKCNFKAWNWFIDEKIPFHKTLLALGSLHSGHATLDVIETHFPLCLLINNPFSNYTPCHL